jgi:hypothetical protein
MKITRRQPSPEDLAWCGSEHAPERAREVRRIGEASSVCGVRDRFAARELARSRLQAQPEHVRTQQRNSHGRGDEMEDPRLAFIYNEALRALQVQLAHFESLHARGATLVFAASFASSLLGGQAMANGLGAWDWLALGLLVGIGSLAVVILWPYYNIHFRFDVEELLSKYVDSASPRACRTCSATSRFS